jgi:DNA-directed RNA polymerase subunit K/omega
MARTEESVTIRPPHFNRYEFVVVSSLRAKQLMAGSTPRVPVGDHNAMTTAQMEVASGCVARTAIGADQGPPQYFWQL